MSENQKKPKREFRNLSLRNITVDYKLPIPGQVSILHRVSGAMLFLALPIILVPLFAASVGSPESFTNLGSGFWGAILKLILLVLIWGFMHHLCAGIRYLTLDFGRGLDKPDAQKSAKLVLIVSITLTVVFAIKMFGVL
ncbi:MAG: succinate dehydrogenase, cytochrome b556 subunit [Alcaligenaceae bacterium]|jgi:succinate dehydrogenase / fumarate reductase cytochrome b subunit|nr:succinate dehydrogenase, cytochrome b556 subunit [Alcaligenaceae bacterium]HZJ96480.1 succinate dehydrogenase, cytochrome b556 subunit [Oligella sp.]